MRKTQPTYYTFLSGLPAPFGDLRLVSDGTALTAIDFAQDETGTFYGPDPSSFREAEPPQWQRADSLPVLAQTAAELREYFAGTRTDFTVPLSLSGTPFQRAVWAELGHIPYGATWSYAELARRIGSPQASRAVGAANGRNPIPIIVPCHRVIGASGQLTGYGGGLPRKKLLLELEQPAKRPAVASGRPLSLFPQARA